MPWNRLRRAKLDRAIEMGSGNENVQRVTFNRLQECLVGTIQGDLDSMVSARFQLDLLTLLKESRTPWLVLDCSGLELLDAADFNSLRRVIAMAELMGTRTVIAGLRPGVVSSLIELDVDVSGLETALNLALALELVEAQRDRLDGEIPQGDLNHA